MTTNARDMTKHPHGGLDQETLLQKLRLFFADHGEGIACTYGRISPGVADD